MAYESPRAIAKELSRNDTGETGGHQAGILIPREEFILAFFPSLDRSVKNPRYQLYFTDPFGVRWKFSYIYYNNRFFGGTRNEYRLTCMTAFLRSANLKAGDKLTLHREGTSYRISYRRANQQEQGTRLKLGSTWRVVPITN
jgi:hypothetical protein